MFDVISWHPMYDVAPNVEMFRDYYYQYPAIIREIKETAEAHGFTGEYWGTDLSWGSYEICNFEGCRGEGQYWELQETDLQVAKQYARVIVLELGMDVATGMDNFMEDRPWSYPTMRNLNTVMAGAQPIDITVKIETEATDVMSFGFNLPDGGRMFALWIDNIAVDGFPGVETRLAFVGLPDLRVVGVDVLHGFEQELITETESGNLVINNLMVKDYPIILRLFP